MNEVTLIHESAYLNKVNKYLVGIYLPIYTYHNTSYQNRNSPRSKYRESLLIRIFSWIIDIFLDTLYLPGLLD